MKILLKDLTKKFANKQKKGTEITAVNNVDLEIPDGSLVGLLGPSGCGKSTTLNMISGLTKPTAGRIFFGEDDVTELSAEHRGVGMVFQNYALYPHLTVKQNITFPLENRRGKDRLTKEEMAEMALEIATLVQIDGLMSRKPSELSGGQQQRVAIARALVKKPRVLLLDEPLSNLDARLRLQTREEIRRIQQTTKITTVFVTHDQEEAMSISDIIVVMRDGVIMQVGAPREVYDDPKNLFVSKFLGNPKINVLSGTVSDGKLFIGGEEVLCVNGAPDGEVYVGIRPEGFEYDEKGSFTADLIGVEVMGRDVSVVCSRPECVDKLRAIIDSDEEIDESSGKVSFSLKPSKTLLFSKETEERIYFEVKEGKKWTRKI